MRPAFSSSLRSLLYKVAAESDPPAPAPPAPEPSAPEPSAPASPAPAPAETSARPGGSPVSNFMTTVRNIGQAITGFGSAAGQFQQIEDRVMKILLDINPKLTPEQIRSIPLIDRLDMLTSFIRQRIDEAAFAYRDLVAERDRLAEAKDTIRRFGIKPQDIDDIKQLVYHVLNNVADPEDLARIKQMPFDQQLRLAMAYLDTKDAALGRLKGQFGKLQTELVNRSFELGVQGAEYERMLQAREDAIQRLKANLAREVSAARENYLIGAIPGAAVGALGAYLVQKLTDKRRRKSRDSED